MMIRKLHKTCRQTALALLVLQMLSCNLLSGEHAAAIAKTGAATPSLAKTAEALAINEKALSAINHGDWTTAEAELLKATGNSSTITHDTAWLAFCYLYQSKRKELQALAGQVATASPGNKNSRIIVETINLVAQNKLAEASEMLQTNKAGLQDDQLARFIAAAIALKQGQAADAANQCELLLKAAPQFAWGYRTLGFIQEKNLQDKPAAELTYLQALKVEPDSKDVTDLLCNLKLSQNDFDGAIEIAQTAIKNNPKMAGNYLRLAQIYIQQWRLKEAQVQLQKAIQLTPGDAFLYKTQATVYNNQKNYQEAIKSLEHAVALSTNKAADLVDLATMEDLAGQRAQAINHLKEALQIDPQQNQPALTKLVDLLKIEKQWDELANLYRGLLKSSSRNATYILGLAEALRGSGHNDEAIEQYKEAANLDQSNPVPHREIAAIQMERHNFGEAAKSLTRALNINAGSLQDLIALGEAYARNGDYVQAETAYMTGLALQQLGQVTGAEKNISSFDIMRSLASVLMQENRYSEAAANLEALKVDKNAANRLLDDYKYCQAALMRDRSKPALEAFIKAFETLPVNTKQTEYLSYVKTLVTLEQYEQALSCINKIPDNELVNQPALLSQKALAELGTNNKEAATTARLALEKTAANPSMAASAYAVMAKVELAQSGSPAAEKLYDKALELAPRSFPVMLEKAVLLLQNKQYGEAEILCRRVQEINPYSWEAYFILAQINDAQGKTKESLESAKKAQELYPGNTACHKLCLDLYRKLKLSREAQEEENILTHLQTVALP